MSSKTFGKAPTLSNLTKGAEANGFNVDYASVESIGDADGPVGLSMNGEVYHFPGAFEAMCFLWGFEESQRLTAVVEA